MTRYFPDGTEAATLRYNVCDGIKGSPKQSFMWGMRPVGGRLWLNPVKTPLSVPPTEAEAPNDTLPGTSKSAVKPGVQVGWRHDTETQ